MEKVKNALNFVLDALRSPRTVAIIKLGIAVIGVVNAIDELQDAPHRKKKIGFVED